MCNYFDNNVPTENLEKEFRRVFTIGSDTVRATQVNGFAHDALPIIQDDVQDEFVTAKWGIEAPWTDSAAKKVLLPLNARIETITDKSTFKNNVNNRCVIPVNAFYEWRWLDGKGKSKEKNRIYTKDKNIFSLGAIYYKNRDGGLSFAICTTEANELMTYIHNIKKRMPIILPIGLEQEWLRSGNNILDFSYPNYNPLIQNAVL